MLRIPWPEHVNNKDNMRETAANNGKEIDEIYGMPNEENRLGEFNTHMTYWIQRKHGKTMNNLLDKFD